MTDKSAKIHDPPSHGTGDLGRQVRFTSLLDNETRRKASKIHVVSLRSLRASADILRADKVHKRLSARRSKENNVIPLRDTLHSG
jgi:hypothetical protein